MRCRASGVREGAEPGAGCGGACCEASLARFVETTTFFGGGEAAPWLVDALLKRLIRSDTDMF